MPKLKQYVGLDVSLKETSIAVIDENDKLVWRGSVPSTPEAIAEALRKHAPRAEQIGLEAGQLSAWLYHGLKAKGCPVTCIDARHVKAALSLKVNKTDANDALGLAQIMRVGWYREVAVKGHDCQALRALLWLAPRSFADHHREELRARHLEDVRPCSGEEVARDVHRQRTRDNRRRCDAGAHPYADAANAGSDNGTAAGL